MNLIGTRCDDADLDAHLTALAKVNDLDEISQNLYLGGKKASSDKERLKSLGIKHILNVTT